MTDAEEVAQLLSQVRALIEADAAMGLNEYDPKSTLPAPARGPEVPVATSSPAMPPPPQSAGARGWSQLATRARQREPSARKQLDHLWAEIKDCRRCDLYSNRRTVVFGVGEPQADLVVIGEAPGYHEDQQGEPFVGPSGEMLNKMLQGVLGLSRTEVYILNVVKCRPPNNRNPSPQEVSTCRTYMEQQLQIIKPKVILVFGAVAFQTLFNTSQGITKNRGNWRTFGDIPVMPTLHPAYLLRQPAAKRLVFEDLKEAARKYAEVGGRRSS